MVSPNVANIEVVSAEVDGVGVAYSGSGPANVDTWALDDTIDMADYTSTVTIAVDFDENHFGSGGTSEDYAVEDTGNLDSIFSSYTLVMNPTTGVLTLTFDPEDFIGAGVSNIQVSGRGDNPDTVNISFICFSEGTQIATPSGPRLVEDLMVGDLVLTKSNGAKPLKWVGSRHMTKTELDRNPHLRPVSIKPGAFGDRTPARRLTVSPQHRIVVVSPDVQLHFGMEEVLVPAKGLVNGRSVCVSDQPTVTYYHLLFDQHEIIDSNGAWTESFFPGEQALTSLDAPTRKEVLELFPELDDPSMAFDIAAPFLTTQEAKLLVRLTH